MKLEHLEYLVEVARCQSMNVAAEKLHITQQALSLAIKSVETEVGAKVLERSYKGVSLTAEGEQLVVLVEDFINRFTELKQDFSTSLPIRSRGAESIRGEIKCIINTGLNHTIFPSMISNFYKQYPDVRINVEEHTAKEIINCIKEGQGDLGLTNALEIDGRVYGVDTDERIEFVPFFTYKLCAIVNKQSALAKYKSISISTLLKEPFILCPERETIDEYLLTKLLKYYGSPKIIQVNSTYLAKQMVIDNMGVSTTIMNDPLLMVGMENVVKIPINNRFKLKTGYIYCKDKPLSEVTKRFIEMIHQTNGQKSRNKQ